MAYADHRSAPVLADRVRVLRPAGAQAQAPAPRACVPKARREQGLRAVEAARKVLALQASADNDPRRNAIVNRARGEAISEGHRRSHGWAREHPGQRDEAWFKREVAPKLDAFPLREIADATGSRSRPVRASEPGTQSRTRGTGMLC